MNTQYKNADAAMAEALRRQAEYHDAMAMYHAISGHALSEVRYREMAQSSREMAVQWQSWADVDSERDAA